MARPREFDQDNALNAAIGVFRDHGFAGSSTAMLTQAMGIGRQSLYDTFGDKWQLYCRALQAYSAAETGAHLDALASAPRAIQALHALIARVVAQARQPCLGTHSIGEFGTSQPDLAQARAASAALLHRHLTETAARAQAEGDAATDLPPDQIAGFLIAQIAAIRLAARAGASDSDLTSLGRLALRALG